MYQLFAEQSASQRAAVHHRGGGIPFPPSYGVEAGQYGVPTPPMAHSPAPRSATPPFNLIAPSLPGTVSTVGTAPISNIGYMMGAGGAVLAGVGSGGSTIGMGSFFDPGHHATDNNATVSSGFPLEGLPPQLSHTVFSLSNDMPIVVNGNEISPVEFGAPFLVGEELHILKDGEVGVPDALRLTANSLESAMDTHGSVDPRAFEAELRGWLRQKGYIGQGEKKATEEKKVVGGKCKVTTVERGSPRFGMNFKCTVSDAPEALRVTVEHRGATKVIPLDRIQYAAEGPGAVSTRPLCDFSREEQVGILSNLQGSYNTVKLGEWDAPQPELIIISQQKGDHRSPQRGGGEGGVSTSTLSPKGHQLPSPARAKAGGGGPGAGADTVRMESPVLAEE